MYIFVFLNFEFSNSKGFKNETKINNTITAASVLTQQACQGQAWEALSTLWCSQHEDSHHPGGVLLTSDSHWF